MNIKESDLKGIEMSSLTISAIKMSCKVKQRFNNFIDTLKTNNITRVIAFNEANDYFSEIKFSKQLTLVIFPLKYYKETDKEKWCYDNELDVDIFENMDEKSEYSLYYNRKYTEPENIQSFIREFQYMVYYNTLNIIVCKINPFINDVMMNVVLKEIKDNEFLILTEEEAYFKTIQEWFFSKTKNEIEEMKSDIRNKVRHNMDMEVNIRTNIRTIRENTINIKHMQKTLRNVSTTFKKSLKEAQELEFVKSIEITNALYITFNEIKVNGYVITRCENDEYCQDNVDVTIGRLKFRINFYQNIKVENMNGDIDGHAHPHANVDGCCFGEIGPDINKAMAELDLKKMCVLLFSWAMSYNPSDKYISLQEFYNREHGTDYIAEDN